MGMGDIWGDTFSPVLLLQQYFGCSYTTRHRSFLNDSELTNPQVQVPYLLSTFSHWFSTRFFVAFLFFLTPSLGSWSSIRYPSTLSTQKPVSLLFNLPVPSHPLRPWPRPAAAVGLKATRTALTAVLPGPGDIILSGSLSRIVT